MIKTLAIIAIVLSLRLPFLNQPVQGDDPYYLAGAEHAQIDPLHPAHAKYLFQGDLVDMRGHPHGPLDSWILAALLALFGDVREIPFHLFYSIFSIIAALAMWSLARRFSEKPFWATLLFLAVPAFVVNGNSFEADLPLLAFWMAAIALFVKAVDEDSLAALSGSKVAAVLAALDAYQAIFLMPVLAWYLFERRKKWGMAWAVTLAAPATILVWWIYERATSGVLPATVLAGYMQTYGLQSLANKARSATALIIHSAWIVSPLIVLAAFGRGRRWIFAAIAAAAAAIYDPNPLFWASVGCAVLLFAACWGKKFLNVWLLVFFAGALLIFYAGSARYLLPIAAPVAIFAARSSNRRILAVGFALQMALSIALAIVNYQLWNAYRQFAASMAGQVAAQNTSLHRTWINAEWGLRWYLEAEGALPMAKDQVFEPGDIVVSSALASLPVSAPLAPIAQMEIRPAIPLRLIALDHRSGYSAGGILPFEISTGPIDSVRAGVVLERKPQLTDLDPADPDAASQILAGLFPDRWMTDKATVLLKSPDHPAPLRVAIYIPPQAPARHVRILADGVVVAEQTFPGPGAYTISANVSAEKPSITITIEVDKTFSVPADQRKLGVVVTKIAF
ncbi:MAG TPA: glycosyltransferase family 39 protein [Bryobacteraceae bacterium]|nr:glycosyltransferase family 39 protein [Bryobacteraceae bacterium]